MSSNQYDTLDKGHKYKLSSGETITFIKRTQGQLVHDGIQNEELLELLIERMTFLQDRLPCIENALTIESLHQALESQIVRTAKRIAQKVETTDIPHV